MDPVKLADLGSTTAGLGAGMSLLSTVHWDLIPHGECVRLVTALFMMAGGYLMYRKRVE